MNHCGNAGIEEGLRAFEPYPTPIRDIMQQFFVLARLHIVFSSLAHKTLPTANCRMIANTNSKISRISQQKQKKLIIVHTFISKSSVGKISRNTRNWKDPEES